MIMPTPLLIALIVLGWIACGFLGLWIAARCEDSPTQITLGELLVCLAFGVPMLIAGVITWFEEGKPLSRVLFTIGKKK